ncbi:UNVERIFIED_CONTAM: hypothetical protein HDU68_010656 [Siphonaria sp. JEL0065]|nr:hypothetical protein HDU68_010656 [Siphonaria sp. JEL0065]
MADAFSLLHNLSASDAAMLSSVNSILEIMAIIMIPITCTLFLHNFGRKTIFDHALLYLCAFDVVLLPYIFVRFSPNTFPRSNAINWSCSIISEVVQFATLLGSASAVSSLAITRLQIFMHPESDSFGAARRRFSDRPSTTKGSQADANLHRRRIGLFAGAFHVVKNVAIGILLPVQYGVVDASQADGVSGFNNTVIGDWGDVSGGTKVKRGISDYSKVLAEEGGVVIFGTGTGLSSTATSGMDIRVCKLADAPAQLMLALWFCEVAIQLIVVIWFSTNYAMKWVQIHRYGGEVAFNVDIVYKRGSADSNQTEDNAGGVIASTAGKPSNGNLLQAISRISFKSASAIQRSLSSFTSSMSLPMNNNPEDAPPVPVLPHAIMTQSPTSASPTNVEHARQEVPTSPASIRHQTSQRNSIVQSGLTVAHQKRSASECYHIPSHMAEHIVHRGSIMKTQRGSIVQMSGVLAASGTVSPTHFASSSNGLPGLAPHPLKQHQLSALAKSNLGKSSTSLLESSEDMKIMARYQPNYQTRSYHAPGDAVKMSIVSAAAVAHKRASIITNGEEPNTNQLLSVHSHSQHISQSTIDQSIDITSLGSSPHHRSFASATAYAMRERNMSTIPQTPTIDQAQTISPTTAETGKSQEIMPTKPKKDVSYSDMESLCWVIMLIGLNIITWLPWVLAKAYTGSNATSTFPFIAGLLAPLRQIIVFLLVCSRHQGVRKLIFRKVAWKDALVNAKSAHGLHDLKAVKTA